MIRIVNVRDHGERLEEAVHYIWKQWGTPSNALFYRDCITQACVTASDLPRFYLAMEDERIVGCYALLRSELNSRQDLSPWFACLYVNPDARGRRIGDQLQAHAVEEARAKGYAALYLCTALTDYYERTSWKYIGQGIAINDDETRIYEYLIKRDGTNPLRQLTWKDTKQELQAYLDTDHPVSMSAMVAGLEAEVTRIDTADARFVLKVWNKASRPNVEAQYRLLDALHNRGAAVSKPFGWGFDREKHAFLLTSYDGPPIAKVNAALIKKLAKILIGIHDTPVDDFIGFLPAHDFVSYFFPSIEDHSDLHDLLLRLVERGNLKQDHIIHGDFNLGNIVENEGVYTTIDWTNGQRGDPRYDAAWSIVLFRIYVGERVGSTYHAAFVSEAYSEDDLELFEAMACVRWLLLHRNGYLAVRKETIPRVKNVLRNNRYMDERLFDA